MFSFSFLLNTDDHETRDMLATNINKLLICLKQKDRLLINVTLNTDITLWFLALVNSEKELNKQLN